MKWAAARRAITVIRPICPLEVSYWLAPHNGPGVQLRAQSIEAHMAQHMCAILTSLRRLLQRLVRLPHI